MQGRHLRARVPGRAVLRPAVALRALAVVVFALAIGVGCFVDRSGRAPAESTYQCTATLRSPDGAVDMADSSMEPWAATICVPFGTPAETEWRRRLFEVAGGDPAVAPLGYSCAEDVVCGSSMALPDGTTCPAPRTASPIPDCGASGARCLDLTSTSPTRTDPGFDLTLDFPATAAGAASAPQEVTIQNTCGDPIRLFVEESLSGRDPTFYGVAANGCAPRDDEERAIGRSLAGGETCTIEFYFEPQAAISFAAANQGLTQDTVEIYRIRLFADEILP